MRIFDVINEYLARELRFIKTFKS